MKFLFSMLFLLWQLAGPSCRGQNMNKLSDGYQQGYLVDSRKGLDDMIYFSTPNFHLYRTDGSASGTEMMVKFPAGSLVYIGDIKKISVF